MVSTISKTFVTSSLLLFSSFNNFAVQAAVTPTAPGPNDVYREGGKCVAEWTPDTTGDWTSFDIDLMSGSNQQMRQVIRIASGLDGTSTTQTSLEFDCPDVTPNSKIYFLQFTQDDADPQWTTRFTLAAEDGSTTTPANATQPGGQAIPWGYGELVGGAASGSASSGGAASGSATRSRSATSATASASSSASSTEEDEESMTSASSSASQTESSSSSAATSSSPASSSTQSSSSSVSNTAPAARTSAPTSGSTVLSQPTLAALIFGAAAAFVGFA